jgi:hypothetical protein
MQEPEIAPVLIANKDLFTLESSQFFLPIHKNPRMAPSTHASDSCRLAAMNWINGQGMSGGSNDPSNDRLRLVAVVQTFGVAGKSRPLPDSHEL